MPHDEILNHGRDDDAFFIGREIFKDDMFEGELIKSRISWYLGKIKTLFFNTPVYTEIFESDYPERLELYHGFEHGFHDDFLPEQNALLKGPSQVARGDGEF